MASARDNLARQNIFIPATQPEEQITLRVAAYCRVSSDSADQLNSFAAQNTHYNTVISTHDHWELVDIYADEGITGTSAAKRGDFQRMLSDCRNGRIDKILVKSISRFARNTAECLEAIRELKALGISVFFEEHNIDTKMVSSEMLTAVLASCAQAESESISKNVSWGNRKRMESGSFTPSSAPYGYRLANGKLVVEESEAAVVQSIFAHYLEGMNPEQIARQLMQTDESGKVWTRHTVEYILKNEKYMGDALLQKQYTTETLPRQKKNNYGERDMFYIENYNPAIISREVYQKATELREQRRGKCSFTAREHMLAGIATCEQCGCLMRVKKKGEQDYLICRTHNEDSESCPITQIPVVTIYESFLRLYFNLSRHGADIFAEMIRNLHTIRNRQMLWHPDVVELNKRISDISNQIHTLTLLNKQGIVESDYFISKNNQLAEQLRKAKQQKEKLLDREDDEIIKQTMILLEVLEDGPEFMDQLDEELFCELIDKIIVESNTKIRFRLKNGLELPESIERTVR